MQGVENTQYQPKHKNKEKIRYEFRETLATRLQYLSA